VRGLELNAQPSGEPEQQCERTGARVAFGVPNEGGAHIADGGGLGSGQALTLAFAREALRQFRQGVGRDLHFCSLGSILAGYFQKTEKIVLKESKSSAGALLRSKMHDG
jgi:hypothetical protein